MISMGFRYSSEDQVLFVKHLDLGRVTVSLVYVDDTIVAGDDKKGEQYLKPCLAKEFEIKELDNLKYFLGIEIAHSKIESSCLNKSMLWTFLRN